MDIFLSQKIQKSTKHVKSPLNNYGNIMMSVTILKVNFLFVVISPCVPVLLDFDSGTYQWRIKDFPQGGAPTPKSAIIFQIFCRTLQKNERIWTPGGRASLAPPLDPPMLTKTINVCVIEIKVNLRTPLCPI